MRFSTEDSREDAKVGYHRAPCQLKARRLPKSSTADAVLGSSLMTLASSFASKLIVLFSSSGQGFP